MKAIWRDKVIADAATDDLIRIEGNWYFPPAALKQEFFVPNDHHTTCFWKGEASYYDVVIDGDTNESAAWYYPQPKDGSVERVGRDFSDYVAFWHGVEIIE
ncbi:MAG TPA: DUF427 domain-containing protein [Patescibacteria group bacterium]|nr:DUF427 domain-containing protein [Patescibacteria group bacterium]